jgi:uncharacterized phiE125 gp8 family phage protein
MGLRLITPPADEPLSLSEVKANLHIDHTDDDAVLTQIIAEAREWMEDRVQQKFMTQTWELVIDYFPANEVLFPIRPVQSITGVFYRDTDGVEQTVLADDYYLDNLSSDAWLFPVSDVAWPTDLLDAVNAVRIRFVAGYESAARVPGAIKRALHLKVRELYEETDTVQAVNNLLMNQIRLEA